MWRILRSWSDVKQLTSVSSGPPVVPGPDPDLCRGPDPRSLDKGSPIRTFMPEPGPVHRGHALTEGLSPQPAPPHHPQSLR